MPPTRDLVWPERMADDIGRRVRQYRQARGLSVQQLADAVAELGVNLGRPVLSNLETGRRHTITVPELLVLARVLQVPPILLVFPLGRDELTEVLPGQEMGTWQAVKWFTGDGEFLFRREADLWISNPDDAAAWRDTVARAVVLWREQDAAAAEWSTATTRARAARKAADVARSEAERTALHRQAESWDAVAKESEGVLRKIRRRMREFGLTPSLLTANLRHVDEDEQGEVTG